MKTVTFKITGMHCDSCKNLIEDIGGDIPGVTACVVDAAAQTGTIEHEDSFDFTAFVKEVEAAGPYTIATL